jgi:hypothetical protein
MRQSAVSNDEVALRTKRSVLQEQRLSTAVARLRLSMWCQIAGIRSSPILPSLAAQYGAETPVLDWRKRLRCSQCGIPGRDAASGERVGMSGPGSRFVSLAARPRAVASSSPFPILFRQGQFGPALAV